MYVTHYHTINTKIAYRIRDTNRVESLKSNKKSLKKETRFCLLSCCGRYAPTKFSNEVSSLLAELGTVRFEGDGYELA